MKVAKKVRLLTKDGNGKYIKNDTYEVLRNRAVVMDSAIEEAEGNYKEVGILYIVDNKGTQEWMESKNPKKKVKVDKLEFEGLEITEENVDQFAEDNGIGLGNIKDVNKKLSKVKDFINKQ